MTPRRAGVADAGKLALVGAATFLETFAHDHDGDAVVRYLADEHSRRWYEGKLADAANACWIVEEAAGCPVGYAVLTPATLPGARDGDLELKRIYVLSKWAGRGLGAALYDAVEAEARARGASRLLLSVYVTNFPAQAFYQKRGFEQIGRWLFEGFDASEDFVMAKVL